MNRSALDAELLKGLASFHQFPFPQVHSNWNLWKGKLVEAGEEDELMMRETRTEDRDSRRELQNTSTVP